MNIIKAIQILIVSLLWATSLSAFAQVKVVVIPMAGEALKPLKNIITVAKDNGDFTDPVEALNSITDSSEANPYLVVIAPGVYNQSAPLVIAGYISVVGSGRHATTLVAAIGATTIGHSTAVVAGSGPGRALSDLSIVNTGDGSDFSIGLFIEDDLLVERLDIVVSGSNNNIGIKNTGDGLIADVTVS